MLGFAASGPPALASYQTQYFQKQAADERRQRHLTCRILILQWLELTININEYV